MSEFPVGSGFSLVVGLFFLGLRLYAANGNATCAGCGAPR